MIRSAFFIAIVLLANGAAFADQIFAPGDGEQFVVGREIPVSYTVDPPDGDYMSLVAIRVFLKDEHQGGWVQVSSCSAESDCATTQTVNSDTWDHVSIGSTFRVAIQAEWNDLSNPAGDNILTNTYNGDAIQLATSEPTSQPDVSQGGQWTIGSQATVTWQIEASSRITGFEIYANVPGQSDVLLTTATAGQRTKSFAVPPSIENATSVYVRCIWENDSQVHNDSQSRPVSVSPPLLPEVTVTYPNTAVTWTIGQQVTITWSSCNDCGITGHTVQLKRGAGSWQTLGSVGAAIQSLNWTVTGPANTSCLIRVTSSVDGGGSVSDQSNATFTIQNEPPAFTDVSASAFSQANHNVQSIAIGDYDDDGWDDLYFGVGRESGESRVFRNSGNGTFSMASNAAVLQAEDPYSPLWLDIDNDGRLDLYVRSYPDNMVEWNGSQFVDFPNSPSWGSDHWLTWVDVEPDGDMDLYAIAYNGANLLYLNDGSGGFVVDDTAAPGYGNQSKGHPAWGDYDLDGDQDLYLPDYVAGDLFYENIGDGRFVEVHSQLFASANSSRIVSFGDVDNDGYLDIALIDDHSFQLFLNEDGMSFVEVPPAVHGLTRSVYDLCLGDFDNDRKLDLAVASWYTGNSAVYAGGGDGSFGLMAEIVASSVEGVAASDYDHDGDLDIFTAPANSARLIRNDRFASGNHWLQIDLIGQVSNREAIGARLVLTAGGVTQTRVVGGGDGRNNQSSQVVSFGLGTGTSISALTIFWPSGIVQDATTAVSADRRVTITEPNHQLSAQIFDGFEMQDAAGNTLIGCPVGDRDELVITIDFDDAVVSGTIAADDVAMIIDGGGFGICGDAYADIDGTSGNGYTVTLRRKHFYGCSYCDGAGCATENVGSPAIRLEYLGEQVGIINGLKVRTPDLSGDGAINLTDGVTLASSYNHVPGDPEYNGCADLTGDNVVNMGDITVFASHNGHSCTATKDGQYGGTVTELVSVEPFEDGRRFKLVLEVQPGMDSASLQIPVDPTVIKSWSLTESSRGILLVECEKDGHPGLFILVQDLEQAGTRRMELLDLVLGGDGAAVLENMLLKTTAMTMSTDGRISVYSGESEAGLPGPAESGVLRVYPNPFNPQVTIDYSIARAGHVQIQIYDVAGRLVRTLVDENQSPAGLRSVMWDGCDVGGQRTASGVYMWTMDTEGHHTSGRVMMVK